MVYNVIQENIEIVFKKATSKHTKNFIFSFSFIWDVSSNNGVALQKCSENKKLPWQTY